MRRDRGDQQAAVGPGPRSDVVPLTIKIGGEPEPLTVLIVDDVSSNTELLEAVIQQPGVRTLRARSGDEALEVVRNSAIDLAVLDVAMPGMTGFELAARLRSMEHTEGVPILFVTGQVFDDAQLAEGYEVGAVDFLFKPVPVAILRFKIHALLHLARQRRQVQEHLRLNEIFLAVLAHDLRNPLSAVVTGSDLLLRLDDPAVTNVAAKIQRSGRRMASAIDHLIDLSQARVGGGIALTPSRVDLGLLLRRAVQEVQLASPARQVTLSVEGDLFGVWDEARLEQVASNLLANAIRHGDASGPIEIEARGHREEVSFTIINRGEIDPANRDRLFEPFKSRSTSQGGLGLGLFIVLKIVEAHGGRIAVESTGGATCFSISIPRAP